MLIRTYKDNKAFLLPCFGMLLCILVILISFTKSEIHLFINRYNSPFFDLFFRYITFLGDGTTPFIAGIFLSFWSFRNSLIIASAATFAGLIAQFFKQFVFYNAPRPLAYFKDIANLHLVQGVDMHFAHSFPSGHAATIFGLCFSLALITQSSLQKTLLLLTAFIVAFSRVYLSQHFLVDIFAGSILGVLCAFFIKMLFERMKPGKIDRSFTDLIKSSLPKLC
jgi:membrane-associated phospholipid phosphatase